MILVDTVQALPITQLDAHPDNPRLIVREEVLSALVDSMKARGFDAAYALLVRPLGDRYQIISGHTRRTAAEQAGLSSVPCWVREMSDEQAFLELVRANNQGELSPLEIGMHALRAVQLSVGGAGNEGGIRQYARDIGRTHVYIMQLKSAAKVVSQLTTSNVPALINKATHIYAISRAPEADWSWLVSLLLAEEWSVKETEAAVGAVLQLGEIPDALASWLDPDKYKRQAAIEAAQDKEGRSSIAQHVASWVKAATEEMQALPDTRGVWLIHDDTPRFEQLNMQQELVRRFKSITGVPSVKRIRECAQHLHDYVIDLDHAYEQWQARRKSADAQAQADAAAAAELRRKQIFYAPTGINGDIVQIDLTKTGPFDAIITDPPYLLSNGGISVRGQKQGIVDKNFEDARGQAVEPSQWVPHVVPHLKPGGAIIATCSPHILYELVDVCRSMGLDVDRDIAVWAKPTAPPLLSADRLQADFEFIFIAYKPGAPYVFNYDEYRSKYTGQPSRVFTVNQCSGNERLGWHDTQKPLELAEKLVRLYVPPDGLLLDPFGGTATFSAAAKRIGRRSVWVEKKPDFFAKAELRLAETPYHWEGKQ